MIGHTLLQRIFNENTFVCTRQPRCSASSLTTVRTSPGSQLVLAKKYHLPLFLHSRAAHDDLVQILREEGFGEDGGRAVGGRGGVVHSFTGSIKDANDYVCNRLEHSRLTQLNGTFSLRPRWDFILGLLSSGAILTEKPDDSQASMVVL